MFTQPLDGSVTSLVLPRLERVRSRSRELSLTAETCLLRERAIESECAPADTTKKRPRARAVAQSEAKWIFEA